MATTCPYCGTFTAAPGPCPACGSRLIPTQPQQPAVYVQQPATPPVIVVHQEAPRFRKSRNWFTQAFTATLGVAAVVLLLCGGVLGYTRYLGHAYVADSESLTASAKKMAVAPLRRAGILFISSDAIAIREGGYVALVGSGRDQFGSIHDVRVFFRVGQFDDTEHWQYDHLTIDGETHR